MSESLTTLASLLSTLEKFGMDHPELLSKPLRFWCLLDSPAGKVYGVVGNSARVLTGSPVDDKSEESSVLIEIVAPALVPEPEA